MQENQNAFQNAGSQGYSNYISIGNQTSTFALLFLLFFVILQLLKSEERYRKLLKSIYPTREKEIVDIQKV